MEVDDATMRAVEELVQALPNCCICGKPASFSYDDDYVCRKHREESQLTDFRRLPWADALEKLA